MYLSNHAFEGDLFMPFVRMTNDCNFIAMIIIYYFFKKCNELIITLKELLYDTNCYIAIFYNIVTR